MKGGWACIGLSVLSLIAAMLLGCGSSSIAPTQLLVAADLGNNRVLVYNVPFSTNQAASFVLGQPDFTHGTENLSADGLAGPTAVALDSNGNVFVAQYKMSSTNACRVTRFSPPFSNGMSESLVLGQANFTTDALTPPSTSSTVWFPMSLAFDTSGRLFVADMMANRTLVFTPPFSNNMAATLVIGQQDFAHWLLNQGGITAAANTLAGLFSVATW